MDDGGFGIKFFLLVLGIVLILANIFGMFSSKKSGAALPLPRPPTSRPPVEERLLAKQVGMRGTSDIDEANNRINNQKNIVMNGYMLTQERRRTQI